MSIDLINILETLYGHQAVTIKTRIESLIAQYQPLMSKRHWVSQRDSMLITYADSITDPNMSGLNALMALLQQYIGQSISAVHLLPFFPYSSDDGFSVIDYRQVRPSAGTWDDIQQLSGHYDLMFDAVINHISSQSDWFRGYLSGQDTYQDYFIECDPDRDYSEVVRPRSLPLLTAYDTARGRKYLWTTFSADQLDINYRSVDVLIQVLDILLMYVTHGARFIRLDAIGFLWKELGTDCMHRYETHQMIRLMRWILEQVNPDVVIITETNVPHEENVSYFGSQGDEAHMVYQFPLPPLTLHAFLRQDSRVMHRWINQLDELKSGTTYFNFLASHDGIGLRPLEGLLDRSEIEYIAQCVQEREGLISYRTLPDGTQQPYELNINYMDAVCEPALDDVMRIDKFIASQAVLLSVQGIPGIYIHSLLGSRNDVKGALDSGINRRINREVLDREKLFEELDNKTSIRAQVLERYCHMLNVRKMQPALDPAATQHAVDVDQRLFWIERHHQERNERLTVIINLSADLVKAQVCGADVLTGRTFNGALQVQPYEVLWIQ